MHMTQEQKQFYRTVAGLVIPMALQNLINVGVTSADVIMLGKVSETVLSASSLAGQVYFVLSLIMFGLTSGAAVLTAQYWGKKDIKAIEKVQGIALRIAVLVALFFALAVWVAPRQIMLLFSGEEPVIAEGIKYLHVISFSYVLSAITMVYLNILRSMERVAIGTTVYAISFATNVVLNAIFIFGLLGCPAMGIRGAALGTVFARVVELGIVVYYEKRYNDLLTFRWKNLFYHGRELMGDFAKYALPVVFNELAWGIGMAVVTAIIGHLGQAAVAANSVTQVTRQLAMVVSFGIAGATAVVLGKTIGEGKEKLAETYARRFLRMAFVLGLCGAVVVLTVSPLARHFLSLSPQAKEYLKYMMYVMSYFCVGQSMTCTLIVGIFRAGGDTRIGLVIDISVMWGFSILAGSVAAFVLKWPVPWVYVLLVSDELIKLPFAYKRYRSKKWLKNITR